MKLKVAEMFTSIQGEGPMAGKPAVFLRLAKCPLRCSFCDSIEVWMKGTEYTSEELHALFVKNGYIEAFEKGAMLVVTGGDPMLQQEALVDFLPRLAVYGELPDTEVETQGTIEPLSAFTKLISRYNVSPKLANSGMSLSRRRRPEVLKKYLHSNALSFFKFPVASEEDMAEVSTLIELVGIPKSAVLLMPVCSNEQEHKEASAKVIEICKRTGFRYSPRLQLAIYNQKTGV